MEIIFYLFNDENNIISTSIIEKILKYHKKIMLYSNNSFDKICSVLSKIKSINKNNASANNYDIEKDRIIQKIMNIINKNENKKQETNKNFNFDNKEGELEEERRRKRNKS